ncbi:GNAT family N-acetyltransferase [Natrinema limicola]|uniref:GCN5-related N-acetyltransferase n=1 Tax=Natrinema limicola JCM 13563 TaxID=1230457 RepID=M0CJ56_9EURY|nr:GNAT family N-acetyltransferase [Natrinema limicola]ELZ22653.1 GCN5-related N-acetyltransferase [Natrinema limicola JCM 13563]
MTRVVRQATVDDIWAVHEIARESWHAVYDDALGSDTVDDVVDDWYAIGDLESAISTTQSRDDAAFLVAETASDVPADGETDCRSALELDGFAHVVPWPEDTTVAFLARLYVRPAVWNDGTGTALLETLETSLAPGFDRVRVPVLTDNEIGIFFSESRGFDRVETRSSGLAAGLEEHVYEKEL